MTTKEKRIERLSELARMAWPELADVEVELSSSGDAVVNAEGCTGFLADICHHDRALDAMEAALYEINRLPPRWAVELAAQWMEEACTTQMKHTAEWFGNEMLKAAKGEK